MTSVKTQIGAKDQAEAVPHTPTSDIPKTNVWDAIKHVRDTLAASVATLIADLASNANGKGASLVGIEDAGGIVTATTVEGALAETVTALNAHIADTEDAHDASAISFAPVGGVAATNVQSAVAEVASEAAADLAAHIADATDAHAASAITNTPSGNIAATTAQAAINELDTEKVAKAGDTITGTLKLGNGTAGSSHWIDGAAGLYRGLQFKTGGLTRWFLTCDGVAESGANAGSNFGLWRYDDAGMFINQAMTINRSTGVVGFPQTPTVAGGTVWHSLNDGAGSGLDADLVDGLHNHAFMQAVTTRTALKALSTTNFKMALLTEADREGIFCWKTGDYSSHITADTDEGLYVKANDTASSSGSWVRLFSGDVKGEWFGILGAGTATDYAAATNRALSVTQLARCGTLRLREGDYGLSVPVTLVDGVRLLGVGQSVRPDTATIDDADFKAVAKTYLYAQSGFTGSTAVSAAATAAGKYARSNVGVGRLMIDCDGHCAYGLRLATCQSSDFEDLIVARATSVNIDEDCLAADVGGTATAGSVNSITIPASVRSSRDDLYNGMTVTITGGTGVGQSRTISDYVGSTGVVTVSSNWGTNPDATSVFTITGQQVTEGNNATINNRWRNIVSWCADASATVGWRQTGNPSNNVNRSTYDNVMVVHANGDGLRCAQCDTNIYSNWNTYAKGTGRGIKLFGNDVNTVEFARALTFINCQPGAGTGTGGFEAAAGTAVSPNKIWLDLNEENSVPQVVVGAGCKVTQALRKSGGVVAPGWELVAASAVASSALTGTTSETQIGSTVSLPTPIGRNARIKVEYGVSAGANNANAKTFRVRFGSAITDTVLRSEDLASNLSCAGYVVARNRNSVSSQVFSPTTLSSVGKSTTANATATRNTDNAQGILFTGQLANSGDSLTLEWYEVYVWRDYQ